MANSTPHKEGGEITNRANQFGLGGEADADAMTLAGDGFFGGQGGAAGALGGIADAGVDQSALQGGFADGPEDNVYHSNVVVNIS